MRKIIKDNINNYEKFTVLVGTGVFASSTIQKVLMFVSGAIDTLEFLKLNNKLRINLYIYKENGILHYILVNVWSPIGRN